jgi:hypothetical protein
VEEFASSSISIYPNPVQSQLNLIVNESNFGQEYTIYNAFGQLMIKDKIQSTNISISVSNFANGNYNLRVGGVVKRFVVEK